MATNYKKIFDSLNLSFICIEEEKKEVLEKINKILDPELLSMEKEKLNKFLSINYNSFVGIEDSKTKSRVELSINKYSLFTFNRLLSSLKNSNIDQIIKNFESYIDKTNHLYIRIRLNDFLKEDKFILTKYDSCIRFIFHIQTYPAKFEKAKEYFISYLNTLKNDE